MAIAIAIATAIGFLWIYRYIDIDIDIDIDILDAYIFSSLDEARRITADWLHDYNSIRPHASLGNKTPYEFSARIESVYL